MLNRKTFLEKCNTIIKDSHVNTGLNPVMELNCGQMLSRGIIYFDHSKIANLIADKTFCDPSKLTHTLVMRNAAGNLPQKMDNVCDNSQGTARKVRATSFDVILFLIPEHWDNGRGFDYVRDINPSFHASLSTDGSSWYNCHTFVKWASDEGIYSTARLSKEMDLYTSPKGNLSKVIVGSQHFDYGNEDLRIDITDIVNKFVAGELCNYGLGIAFSPKFEEADSCIKTTRYCGFFTDKTHTFYEPYVETVYDDTIADDRRAFYLDKPNRLYFYASVGSKMVNLDQMPTCEIDGIPYVVKQQFKGVYYVDIEISSAEYGPDTMLYDTWSNIVCNGKRFPDVEMDFVTKSEGYFGFGLPVIDDARVVPVVTGINFKEHVKQGEIRKIQVICKIPYTTDQEASMDGLEYRLYVLEEDNTQRDIIGWCGIDRTYQGNCFLIDTSELIPTRYFVDVRISRGMEQMLHCGVLEFDVVNDAFKKV